MSTERVIYVQRPTGEPLWLPELMMEALRLKRSQRLTPSEFEHREIQDLLGRRDAAERADSARKGKS